MMVGPHQIFYLLSVLQYLILNKEKIVTNIIFKFYTTPNKSSFSPSLAEKKGKLHLDPNSLTFSGFPNSDLLVSTKNTPGESESILFQFSSPGDLRRLENE